MTMNPPLKTKDVHHNQPHTHKKQKQKNKRKTLNIPHPSIKQQILIPHLIPLPLARLKHILHPHITHQLIIYPHPPLSQFHAQVPVRIEDVKRVVPA